MCACVGNTECNEAASLQQTCPNLWQVKCGIGFCHELLFCALIAFLALFDSPMHRTDVYIDAFNFQPMNGIKQHLGG